MAVPVAENVYWVGAVDWEVRHFHGYTYHTHRGTSYNAYLVVDEQVALVDTVMRGFEDEMLRHIAEWDEARKYFLRRSGHRLSPGDRRLESEWWKPFQEVNHEANRNSEARAPDYPDRSGRR